MGITYLTVFVQGLLSFFSPCVLPLLPVYMGYLSGGTVKVSEDGEKHYDRMRVMVNTIFFVIGISFAFFLLGMGISALGRFFSGNQIFFVRIGGIIVILFGLYQFGVFGSSRLLSSELKLPINIGKLSMSPITALIMGFVISFAWSPCIGPVLSSVLIMAASSDSAAKGFLLISIYTLGYIIPFLLVGMFTTTLLEIIGRHRNVVRYTVKIGAALMILMGILMFTGHLNGISSYLSRFTGAQVNVAEGFLSEDGNRNDADTSAVDSSEVGASDSTEDMDGNGKTDFSGDNENGYGDADEYSGDNEYADEEYADEDGYPDGGYSDENGYTDEGYAGEDGDTDSQYSDDDKYTDEELTDNEDLNEDESSNDDLIPAPDFSLTDQFGKVHSLSDYRGKIIFLNFWATWCPPCRAEMPDIQKLYEKYSSDDSSDVVILGVAFPNQGDETDAEGIAAFLEENGYTYPVLMDEGATLQLPYYITAFPTTFLINAEGNVLGYIPGMMTGDIMEDVINETRRMAD